MIPQISHVSQKPYHQKQNTLLPINSHLRWFPEDTLRYPHVSGIHAQSALDFIKEEAFLTSYATSTKHCYFFIIFYHPQRIFDFLTIEEIPKLCCFGVDCILKGSNGIFIIISSINNQSIFICNKSIPIFGIDIFTHLRVGID